VQFVPQNKIGLLVDTNNNNNYDNLYGAVTRPYCGGSRILCLGG